MHIYTHGCIHSISLQVQSNNSSDHGRRLITRFLVKHSHPLLSRTSYLEIRIVYTMNDDQSQIIVGIIYSRIKFVHSYFIPVKNIYKLNVEKLLLYISIKYYTIQFFLIRRDPYQKLY